MLNTVPTKRLLLKQRRQDVSDSVTISNNDGEIVENLMQSMEGPASLDSIEVVDSLIKDGMSQAYKKLMHVKDQFKKAPRTYDATETNIKILYKEKIEKDLKTKEEEDAEKLELLSMKDYISAFCKQYNVNLRV